MAKRAKGEEHGPQKSAAKPNGPFKYLINIDLWGGNGWKQ